MGYGLKYVAFTVKFRKSILDADDTCLKIMKDELKREIDRRHKERTRK